MYFNCQLHILVWAVFPYAGTVQELLPPPGNVQLVEQSIDPVTHSLKMIVKWDPVEAESSSDVIGYAVYVDDELYCSVNGVETCEAELHGLVPKVCCACSEVGPVALAINLLS